MKKVCVVGLGYIGLPTALVAAEHGLSVIGCDINEQRIACLQQGDPDLQEPGITERLSSVLEQKAITFRTTPCSADYFILAVPTPFKEEKKADLSYVWSAADALAPHVATGATIILESTVPVGATDELARRLSQATGLQAGIDFFVAHCPERVLPGRIFEELINNNRVIGGINKQSAQRAREFYAAFVQGQMYLTHAVAAEMVKLMENSYRDVQVAFAHQVASMAHAVDLDPYQVIELANKHPRVNILRPTSGVGGHCLAVDPWFLVETFPQESQLLKTARHINDKRPLEVLDQIDNALATWHTTHDHKPRIAVLGVTYKPNTDDLRESPALHIAQTLAKRTDIALAVCEPHVTEKKIQDAVNCSVVSWHEAVEWADIIICLVGHTVFTDLARLRSDKKILDFCGMLHSFNQDEWLFWPAALVRQKDETLHVDAGNKDACFEFKEQNQ